jgi:crossover junction endodeoxyribonuclease RuvC
VESRETGSDSLIYEGSGIISTPADMPYSDRLDAIYSSIQTLVEKFSPEVAIVEEIFFNLNAKTAISVGQARGVILLALQHMKERMEGEFLVEEINPTTAKKTLTGKAKASKKTMQKIVEQELDLSDAPEPDDAADGLALALCYCIRERFQSNIQEQ